MSAENNYLDALEITSGLAQKSAKARLNTVDLLIECEQLGLMPLFKEHLETEKDNNVRASILAYMKEQGEDIKPYITLDKLRAMLNGWAKKPSTEIERFTNIPALTWDDGTPLSFEEITGLLTQAIARKMIIDDGFFSIIFTRLDERCHRPLSDWALTQWVTLATGAADIKQQVSQMRERTWQTDDMNERDRLQKAVAKLEPTAKWSAASIKGLLSLTFHATPALMASKVKTFIRTYGKTQPAQCAQMVNVLGNVSSDTTLQLLVMISKNHNKAGVKALAGQLVEQEAEKRNLTPEQLEDKAIPTLDFDMEGERRFEEVDRLFMLDEHLTPQMRKLDYTPIKSIPASADKEVKAEISNMKKMLKEVAKEQPKRLMLALMSDREWTWDDWRNDYWYHPLMRLLCGRALWEMTLQDGSSVVVRPCEDDFLTSYGESIPQVFTKVKLVHASSLPKEQRTAWVEHFEEFEVTPLLWQFTTCQMPADEMATTAKWTGLTGFLWDDSMFVRTMRGFGFISGEVMDAGGIEGFTFQTDGGITVQVSTSWYNVSILNEPVAITGVTFSKADEPIFFKDVPPGLLHNVISFLEAMKDKASYDEHWRKKVII
jgi:hypothetical protein